MAKTPITPQWRVKLATALICSAFGWQAHAADNAYRTFEQIEAQLQTLAKQHPERVHLHSIGKSAGGKPLYLLSIHHTGKIKPEHRPALFVGANIAGFHHAGSEAAMHLIDTLANSTDKKVADLLSTRTLYIAPLLNPDAHAGLFQTPRQLRARNGDKNAGKLDHDLDGLIAEDDANDLDGNGIITQMRIKDATGDMVIDPKDPRRMIKADTGKGERGTHRVFVEGKDDDKDGLYNEDGTGGIIPDRNFAAGFPVADSDAGAWPSLAPETKAIMDALLARPNIAMAVVFGPANQLLSAPTGFERVTPPGATPAAEVNKPEADDLKVLSSLAEPYKKSLDQAGLDSKRSARQTGKGSLANWLYFHYGVQTIELDVWGAPAAKTATATATPTPMATPTNNDKKAPLDPERDLLAYLSEHNPSAIVPWKKITLDDGKEVEVGGVDPYAEYAPSFKALTPAIAVHSEQVMNWAGKLGQLELVETKAEAKGDDVWLVSAVGALQGDFPSHTKLAAKMRNKIPVRLEMRPGKNVSSLTLNRAVTAERLDSSSTIKAEWLVKASKGDTVDIALWSNQAGRVLRTITLGE